MQFIDKYLEYYKEEIYDIKIYVKNRTIASNRYFSYSGGGDIKSLTGICPPVTGMVRVIGLISLMRQNQKM